MATSSTRYHNSNITLWINLYGPYYIDTSHPPLSEIVQDALEVD